MQDGVHYAEFHLLELGTHAFPYVGVVGPSFDARRRGAEARRSEDGWMFDTSTSKLYHGGRWSQGSWAPEGRPHQRYASPGVAGRLKQGDVVGLLLDLDAGTLTVCCNGQLGLVVPSEGPRGLHGGRLTGPLRWATDVCAGVAVQLDGQKQPRAVAAQLRRQTRPAERECAACTFRNPPAARLCEMCDTPLR